jgi:hypothetical protein
MSWRCAAMMPFRSASAISWRRAAVRSGVSARDPVSSSASRVTRAGAWRTIS